ncbi:MAG: YqeG family HAD IIIA-type phosphatase [Oscillospiraceae bacterium]|nr:YqeG family HAD IIIA-type phosphatase [Oscillospiraceae bacterium]
MILYPDYKFKKLVDITVEDLKSMGVKGIAVDLDNTMAIDNTDDPGEGVVEWLAEMKKAGFKISILSNSYRKRARNFAKSVGGIDWVAMALKPSHYGYYRVKKKFKLKAYEIAMIGDQIFTDIIGANLAGMVSVYVFPYEVEKRSVVSYKIKRHLEKILFVLQDAGTPSDDKKNQKDGWR